MARTATRRKTNPAPVRRPQAVVVPQPPKSLMQVCADAARDPKVDVAKMQAILGMLQNQEAEKAKAAWNAAMFAAQAEIAEHRIVKQAWNPHTRSHYIKLEKLSDVVDPIARKHGFVLGFGMADSPKDNHYRITCDVAHSAGYTKHVWADIGEDTSGPKGGGTKSAAQGSGSSIAYGRRYLKGMIFDVNIAGQDDDGAGGKQHVIDKKQLTELTAALQAKGAPSEAKFLEKFGIEALDQLPAKRFREAMDRIADRIEKATVKEIKVGADADRH